MSNNTVTVIGARNTGRKNGEGKVGGIYVPKNGDTPARFEFILMVNSYGQRNAEGERPNYAQTYMCTVWNSANSQPGKGLADVFAKNMSIGKELKFAELERRPFEGNVMMNGEAIINQATGQPLKQTIESYILRNFEFGAESKKCIADEIAAWTGEMTWGVRPPCFDGTIRADAAGNLPVIPGTMQLDANKVLADTTVWEQLSQKRRELVYADGMQYYGYAVVRKAAATAPAGTTAPSTPSGTNPSGTTPVNALVVAALAANPQLVGKYMANPTITNDVEIIGFLASNPAALNAYIGASGTTAPPTTHTTTTTANTGNSGPQFAI